MLPSYRNQSIDLHSKLIWFLANQLTGFYIRATLALNNLKWSNQVKWYLSTLGGSKLTLILGIRRDGRFDVFLIPTTQLDLFPRRETLTQHRQLYFHFQNHLSNTTNWKKLHWINVYIAQDNHWRCSTKKVLLKFRKFHWKTHMLESLLIKFQTVRPATLLKRDSCEIWKILKNKYFEEHLRLNAFR